MRPIEIRPAQPAEAALLKAICLAAKRSWGYSDAFMQRFAAEITIDAEALPTAQLFVASLDSEVVGWARLLTDQVPMILDDLWVLPNAMGQGVGRQLFEHAIRLVQAHGQSSFELDADPNAQAFYERMGCYKVGETFSSMGRSIPRMRYRVGGVEQ